MPLVMTSKSDRSRQLIENSAATRECLAAAADTSFSGRRVARELDCEPAPNILDADPPGPRQAV